MGPFSYMQNFLTKILGIPSALAAGIDTVGGQTGSKVSPVTQFVGKINKLIINPIITLLFAAALVYFIYGVVMFIIDKSQGGGENAESGKRHMLWGIVGMAIMLSVFGILRLIQSTLGVDNSTINLP